jgi:hypothetical protein
MYLRRTTIGIGNDTVGERSSTSSRSRISALPARTRQAARRTDTTLNGSKLAFKTSTSRTTSTPDLPHGEVESRPRIDEHHRT